MSERTLIIGGVAGGATAAARLRRLNERAEIIVFERGEYISYANCGLPYYVGDVIKNQQDLLLMTPDLMKKRFNIDVRVNTEVIEIDRDKKLLKLKSAARGEYTEQYDTLVISTGSSPLRPPIPGIDSERIHTLWTVPDALHIRQLAESDNIGSAIVVGGGFIGLEMAENLSHMGLDVTIAEMLDQVMAPIDFEMAQLVHEHLEQKGVTLCLGDGVKEFKDNADGVEVLLGSGKRISADMIILSIGVRPNSELAKAAGLQLNERGGIVVDKHMRTSDPAIYAVGDAVETINFPQKEATMVPLAGPANKQGRIAANIIAGQDDEYDGTQGTAIAKIFDLSVASVGENEKILLRRGLTEGKDYRRLWIMQNSHAGYYPGATMMALKLLFSMDGSRILGAQIVGHDGVDKRIDVLSTAMRLGAGVHDLTRLELAYAPPYSSAKDPVNMAGYVAENIINGLVSFSNWDAIEKMDSSKETLLDVREEVELKYIAIDGAKNIPLGELRNRLYELDKSKHIIVMCAAGVRAHTAARMLANNGFENVSIYPGGIRFYSSTHYNI